MRSDDSFAWNAENHHSAHSGRRPLGILVMFLLPVREICTFRAIGSMRVKHQIRSIHIHFPLLAFTVESLYLDAVFALVSSGPYGQQELR
jgi:hypothetical protein